MTYAYTGKVLAIVTIEDSICCPLASLSATIKGQTRRAAAIPSTHPRQRPHPPLLTAGRGAARARGGAAQHLHTVPDRRAAARVQQVRGDVPVHRHRQYPPRVRSTGDHQSPFLLPPFSILQSSSFSPAGFAFLAASHSVSIYSVVSDREEEGTSERERARERVRD